MALEYPSYGVRRITVMFYRRGMTTSRKKVYRLMKLANPVGRKVSESTSSYRDSLQYQKDQTSFGNRI
jgi:hypothetical protein